MADKALVFSPPPKFVEGRAGEAEVPILLLQPFSKPPQVTFERIPVGREAVRQLKVLNTTNTDHTVTLSDELRKKGFRADAQAFKLLPGQHQLVSFSWRPDGRETSSRLAVSVSTDKGYKGRFVLLGTVREGTRPLRPPREKTVPKSSILTCSQKPNVSSRATTLVQTPKKADSAPVHACKKTVPPIRVTIPKEFKSSASKNAGRENRSSKVSTPAQVSKKAASATPLSCKKAVPPARVTVPQGLPSHPNKDATSDPLASDLDVKLNTVSQEGLLKAPITCNCNALIAGDTHSLLGASAFSVVSTSGKSTHHDRLEAAACTQDIRRETFPCNAPALETTTNTTKHKTANTAFENSLEMSVNTFEDSLEQGKLAVLAAVDAATARNSEENSDSGNNDTFELDLSARMEMLYQQILERQSCTNSQEDSSKTATTSAVHEHMSGEQTKAPLCTPQKAKNEVSLPPALLQAISNERHSSPRCPAKASKEDSLPNLETWLTELELGASRDPRCSVDESSLLEMIENYGSTELFEDPVSVEDFFPSDVSSINQQPGHSTHGY